MAVTVFKIKRLMRTKNWPKIEGKKIDLELIEKLKKNLAKEKFVRIGDFDLTLEPFDSLATLDLLVRKNVIELEVVEKCSDNYYDELEKVDELE